MLLVLSLSCTSTDTKAIDEELSPIDVVWAVQAFVEARSHAGEDGYCPSRSYAKLILDIADNSGGFYDTNAKVDETGSWRTTWTEDLGWKVTVHSDPTAFEGWFLNTYIDEIMEELSLRFDAERRGETLPPLTPLPDPPEVLGRFQLLSNGQVVTFTPTGQVVSVSPYDPSECEGVPPVVVNSEEEAIEFVQVYLERLDTSVLPTRRYNDSCLFFADEMLAVASEGGRWKANQTSLGFWVQLSDPSSAYADDPVWYEWYVYLSGTVRYGGPFGLC